MYLSLAVLPDRTWSSSRLAGGLVLTDPPGRVYEHQSALGQMRKEFPKPTCFIKSFF